MEYYLVNNTAQPTGEHDVHKYNCDHLPGYQNRKILGSFSSCKEAVKKAKEFYNNVDGCRYCCKECHKK